MANIRIPFRIADIAGPLLIAVVPILLIAVYFWPSPYTLVINNFTKDEITITSARLNDDVIFDGAKSIAPKITLEDRRNGRPGLVVSYMRSVDPQLIISGQRSGQGEFRLTCELKDAKGAGCKFFATLKDGNELLCICDSYADFLD